MPLDRPITIGIRGPDDTNAAGQFVPGAVELYPVFATALDIIRSKGVGDRRGAAGL